MLISGAFKKLVQFFQSPAQIVAEFGKIAVGGIVTADQDIFEAGFQKRVKFAQSGTHPPAGAVADMGFADFTGGVKPVLGFCSGADKL